MSIIKWKGLLAARTRQQKSTSGWGVLLEARMASGENEFYQISPNLVTFCASQGILLNSLLQIFPNVHSWHLGKGTRMANGPCFLTANQLDRTERERQQATRLIDHLISSSAIQNSSTQPSVGHRFRIVICERNTYTSSLTKHLRYVLFC